MRKGFTLIEIQAVIILLAIVIVISIPSIVERLRKSELETKNMIETTSFAAARSYIMVRPNNYKLTEGKKYCILLKDLFKEGELSNKIFNNNVGNNYDLEGFIAVSIGLNSELSFEFSSLCVEV